MSAAVDIGLPALPPAVDRLLRRRAELIDELAQVEQALSDARIHVPRLRHGTNSERIRDVLQDWRRRAWIMRKTGLKPDEVHGLLGNMVARGLLERRGPPGRYEYRVKQ